MVNIEIEEWRDIPGYEGIYQVSNLGHVKRIKRAQGSGLNTNMRSAPNHYGYPRVSLCRNNIPKQRLVHCLVALAFLGECPKGMEVNHIDGVKTNANLTNLEYVTSKGNSEHASRLGLMPNGIRHHNAKLNDNKVKEIRQRYSFGGVTQKELAIEYNVSHRTIGDVIKLRLWKHIT